MDERKHQHVLDTLWRVGLQAIQNSSWNYPSQDGLILAAER